MPTGRCKETSHVEKRDTHDDRDYSGLGIGRPGRGAARSGADAGQGTAGSRVQLPRCQRRRPDRPDRASATHAPDSPADDGQAGAGAGRTRPAGWATHGPVSGAARPSRPRHGPAAGTARSTRPRHGSWDARFGAGRSAVHDGARARLPGLRSVGDGKRCDEPPSHGARPAGTSRDGPRSEERPSRRSVGQRPPSPWPGCVCDSIRRAVGADD